MLTHQAHQPVGRPVQPHAHASDDRTNHQPTNHQPTNRRPQALAGSPAGGGLHSRGSLASMARSGGTGEGDAGGAASGDHAHVHTHDGAISTVSLRSDSAVDLEG